MEGRWLNLYLRYSNFTFGLKQRIVSIDNFSGALPYAVLLILSELGFVLISIPLYFLVPPRKLQERGYLFPMNEMEPKHVDAYLFRRKISLATVFGAVGVWIAKVAFLSFASVFLLGVQQILAYTQNWDLSNSADYTYDNTKISVTGGLAQLVDQGTGGSCGGTASACTTFVSTSTCGAQGGCSWGGGFASSTINSGFDVNAAGWTYYDSESNPRVNGNYVGTGGNPGGHVNITFTARNNDTASGYWQQAFTTAGVNPSGTLQLDWSVSSHSGTGLASFILYVFVDSATGAPTLGTEVWSQTVTTATPWTSIPSVDISSRIASAGTHYLKIMARRITAGGASGVNTAGFDNVVLSWSKASTCSGTATSCSAFVSSTACNLQSGCSWGSIPVYPTSSPSITPNSSLSPAGVTGWSSFTETANKGTGEIYYQLSNNDGATWKYWSGSAWATSTTSTNRNTASEINANISSFSIASGKIMWRAFLSSQGSQVSLDNVGVGYLQNDPPNVTNFTTVQNVNNGRLYIGYNLTDAQSDPSSLVVYEYSLNGTVWSTMTPVPSDPDHSGVSGLAASPTGVAHTFVWNANNDLGTGYFGTVRVRMRANDGIADGNVSTSSIFAVDYSAPIVSSVTATQASGSSDVNIGYDLTENTSDNNNVEIRISSDGGSTWSVATTSVVGDVGNVTSGNGKSITWHAGVDIPNVENNAMMVGVRGRDKYQNQGNFANSSVFVYDNKFPVVATTTDLLAQPLAGSSAVLVGGSFAESNPNTNEFSVAVNGSYGAGEAGDTHTATPSNKYVSVPTVLTGIDKITAVKIIHTDSYGHATLNENTSPATSYKYVKPYTPPAPSVALAGTGALDVTVNKHASEVDGLEYAIFESFSSSYVQADGTLGASPYWQAASTTHVTGLSDPLSQYVFAEKSRNTSDSSHAASSESDLGSGASYNYVSPVIAINSVAETTNGTKYVVISYTGTDRQNTANNLNVVEYSTDGSSWQSMTEKSGVGDGAVNLPFTAAGRNLTFAWDVANDLPNFEDQTVYIRLRSNDGTTNSNLALSSAFAVDTMSPSISNISARQTVGTRDVLINYDLSDGSPNLNVTMVISDDSGVTYLVPTTSVSGDIGLGVNAGVGRSIVWHAGIDLPNVELNTMRVRLYAKDNFGNIGQNAESGDFTADTKAPTVSLVSVAQVSGSAIVEVRYTLTEFSTTTVLFEISDNSGATWIVPTNTHAGDVGAGVTSGSRTFTWNAVADYPDADNSSMRVRVKGIDVYNNSGAFDASSDFRVNTRILSISSITALQNVGSKIVTIHYNINKSATTSLQISPDGGATWGVATTTLSGDIGQVGSGNNKTITWNPGTDYDNEDSATMRIRMRGIDELGVLSPYYESANFFVDTAAPIGLSSLSRFSGNTSTVTMRWAGGVIDSNFDHYELWHGTNEADVNGRTGTAVKWSTADDPMLANITTISTVINGLNVDQNYFVKIWGVDRYGSETTLPAVNVYVPIASAIEIPAGGWGAVLPPIVQTILKKPILSGVTSPTSNGRVEISGLASTGSSIDLYDGGILIKRLALATGADGRFSEVLDFAIGEHVLTARAVDNDKTSDVSDPLYLTIVAAPAAPVILSPRDGERTTNATPKFIGATIPLAPVEVSVDDQATFSVISNSDGAFELTIPNSFALKDGVHTFVFRTIGTDGKRGPRTTISITKYSTLVQRQPRSAGAISIPSATVIREVVGATEMPGIPTPEVANVTGNAGGETISFNGKALPNQDIVVYVHSDQALVYRTRSDENGVWTIAHSQAMTELSPGEHTVYAVALDPSTKAKSRPSPVAVFTVKKNFWISVYQTLNLKTTAATLVVLVAVTFWYYLLRKKGVVGI